MATEYVVLSREDGGRWAEVGRDLPGGGEVCGFCKPGARNE